MRFVMATIHCMKWFSLVMVCSSSICISQQKAIKAGSIEELRFINSVSERLDAKTTNAYIRRQGELSYEISNAAKNIERHRNAFINACHNQKITKQEKFKCIDTYIRAVDSAVDKYHDKTLANEQKTELYGRAVSMRDELYKDPEFKWIKDAEEDKRKAEEERNALTKEQEEQEIREKEEILARQRKKQKDEEKKRKREALQKKKKTSSSKKHDSYQKDLEYIRQMNGKGIR